MAIIIGRSSQVELIFPGNIKVTRGIESVDFGWGSKVQRLYTFGGQTNQCGVNEWASIQSAEIQINWTNYGGVTPEVNICTPTSCSNSTNKVIVTINPSSCTQLQTINAVVFINSYSYSKGRSEYSKESWAGTGYDVSIIQSYQGGFVEPPPTYVISSISEGSIECEDPNIDLGLPGVKPPEITDLENLVGTRFREYDLGRIPRKSIKGSASASQKLTEAMATIQGTFKSVGNSVGYNPDNPAPIARAQVTIPNNPVYLNLDL